MYNSADSDVDSSRNSPALDAEFTWNRSSAQNQYQEALDLRDMPAVTCKQQLDMALEGARTSCLAGEEQILEKKKLLAQLNGMNPGAAAGISKAFFESAQAFHESSKVFRENSTAVPQSNPCRVCRFCGREFPSGRALGGHMRVHGALLDAQLISMKQEKQVQQCEGKQQYAEKQKHRDLKLGSKARSSVASGVTLHELSPSKDCKINDRYQQAMDGESAENYGEEAGPQFVKSEIHEKVDFNCTTLATIKRKEGKDDHLFNVSYSLEYPASKTDSTHIPGIENLFHKNSALYELRRNPKPSQRLINKEGQQIRHSFNVNSHSAQQLPSTSPAETDTQQYSHSPESAHPCSECSKVFSSWKALFGHMRCHPEREWRGIQRPDATGELDRMAKMITRRPSAEGSTDQIDFDQPNQTKINSMKLEIAEESANSDVMLDSKQLITVNHSKDKCLNINELLDSIAKEKAAPVSTGEALMLEKVVREALTKDLDCSTRKRNQLGEQANIKNHSSEFTLQESMTNDNSHLEAMVDDWTPSWSVAGKRSKRRRVSHMHTEPTLTSIQMTSDEIIKMDQTGYNAEEYMEDLVDPANCLVLLSKSMPEVNKSSTAESALFEPRKAWQAIANVNGLERGWDNTLQNRMHEEDDYESENHNVDDDNDDADDDDDDGGRDDDQATNKYGGHMPPTVSTVKYQCSTCKKCFNSHQALGGHRASHRKMKGCFARMKSLASYDAQESSEENNTEEPEYNLSFFYKKGKIVRRGPSLQEDKGTTCKDLTDKLADKKELKGHECSICHRIFMTGQALGGHKRCHWTGEKASGVSDAASVASSSSTENRQQTSIVLQEREEWGYRSSLKSKEADVFDLNLPAPVDEDDEAGVAAKCTGVTMNAKLRPQMWKQQEWSCPAKVAHIPQVCSVKTL
ncbi:hypothetical protein L7F22_052522 [Adiantum nelumboides]|nr:hypothetical protein [Adiantum nelumboides]